jgi:hypothetical protein
MDEFVDHWRHILSQTACRSNRRRRTGNRVKVCMGDFGVAISWAAKEPQTRQVLGFANDFAVTWFTSITGTLKNCP